MKPVYGVVVEAGGGRFEVLVDRDTDHYPEVGQRVVVRATAKKDDNTRGRS